VRRKGPADEKLAVIHSRTRQNWIVGGRIKNSSADWIRYSFSIPVTQDNSTVDPGSLTRFPNVVHLKKTLRNFKVGRKELLPEEVAVLLKKNR